MKSTNYHKCNTAPYSLIDIYNRRVVFLVGKGGVGKTILSIALALSALKLGKKVLLVETGGSTTIGSILLQSILPSFPIALSPNLWGVRIESKNVLEEYVQVHVNLKFIANRITKSKLFEHLSDATPGLKEVMTIGQIWRWEQERTAIGDHAYDMIIVDAPATGHGLSLLRVPHTLIDMLKTGPVVEQTRIVLDMLLNPEITWITMVTLPEELPVNEAIEFQTDAQKELKMPVRLTFVNGVYPKIFSDQQAKTINSLIDQKQFDNLNDDEKTLISAAHKRLQRTDLQQKHIRQLIDQSNNDVLEIPFFFTNDMKRKEIDQISSILINHFNSLKTNNNVS